ncbi:unnamed protein product, partial [Discosporangium mesarthrocarpum]
MFRCWPCPAGRFGSPSLTGASLTGPDCTGSCAPGYYCPGASTSPDELECGEGSYCPEGSSTPLKTPSGTFSYSEGSRDSPATRTSVQTCPRGRWCPGNGLSLPCPAGTFGDAEGVGVEGCSGWCKPGTYCGEGAVQPEVCRGLDAWPSLTIIPQHKSLLSFYCPQGTVLPRANPCPAGTFGKEFGLTGPACSGTCPPGYYCPAGSTGPYAHPCGSPREYCPQGSGEPVPVSWGFYTHRVSGDERGGGATRDSQTICGPGTFCVRGEAIPCPPGTYGTSLGLGS